MYLLPLPAFADNYIWMLHDGRCALVVDPGDATLVLRALQDYGLQLQTILVTHHHCDHTAGIEALRAVTGADVWGPAHEKETPKAAQGLAWTGICAQSAAVQAPTWLGLRWEILDVPGHTAGHIAYYCHAPTGQEAAEADAPAWLFCGDTLFSGGCGRLFEGTAAQMWASLRQLSALPDHALVCCAHEYTVANLRFARVVEPDNIPLAHYQRHCEALRTQNQPTLPARLGQERDINPFLRTHLLSVALAVRQHAPEVDGDDPVAVFAALRTWKNNFR